MVAYKLVHANLYVCITILLFQIFRRLHKACLCLSHRTTVQLVDDFGKQHDKPVSTWRDEIFERQLLKVCKSILLCQIIFFALL